MKQQQKALISWYKKNYRDLPWRKTTDAYSIWISEIMLQQTRAQAVIPFYENFLAQFPNLKKLAKAPVEDVLAAWSGLGYYSRARNIHKAAKQMLESGFPNNYQDLLKISGFGPYTSRAVASFAFGESVAVLDGNVIRFLSRFHNLRSEWWKSKERNLLQEKADEWVEKTDSSIMNQALIELGATICTPTSAACMLCPLKKYCKAFKEATVEKLPLKKLKKKNDIWLIDFQLLKKGKKIALQENKKLPFLKNQFLCPASGKQLKTKPAKYMFKHTITKYNIYVNVNIKQIKTGASISKDLKWIDKKDIKKWSPFSLTTKVFQYAKKDFDI